jgi:Uma2 family endonuclease
MSTLSKPRLTPEQYLEIEDAAEYKSEYFQGEMFAMAGATEAHNDIAGNTFFQLASQLRDRCSVSGSDQRIHIPRTGLFTYPDVVVTCGQREYRDRKRMNLLNPTVIIEVLSPSTEAYDRGRKFEHYQSIDSFREYLLIASDRVSVTRHRRQPNNEWLGAIVTDLEGSIDLESIGCTLLLRDLYDNVTFAAETAAE